MTLLVIALAAVQVGAIAAVTALAAPAAFAALGTEAAGRYLRRLFPRYFAAAAALALAAAAAALAGGHGAPALLLAGDAACFILALALIPRINAARERGDPAFGRLHGYSVAANGIGLALALAALSWLMAA